MAWVKRLDNDCRRMAAYSHNPSNRLADVRV